MDSWMGTNSDPVSLHKYLYANADPVNGSDPSGMFTLSDTMMAQDLRSTLANMQAEVGFTMLDVLMNKGEYDPGSYIAGAMIFGTIARVAPRMLGVFLKACKNSFVEGTLVHVERGRIPIEQVKIGERVWSYNEKTGEEGWNEVLHLIEGEKTYELVTITTENGEVFAATEEHPLYTTDGRWIDASEIKVGEQLVREGGGRAKVVSVTIEVRQARVWNLTVANAETFYIGEGGVLVHNSNPACRPEIIEAGAGRVLKMGKAKQHEIDTAVRYARAHGAEVILRDAPGRDGAMGELTLQLKSVSSQNSIAKNISEAKQKANDAGIKDLTLVLDGSQHGITPEMIRLAFDSRKGRADPFGPISRVDVIYPDEKVVTYLVSEL